MSPFRVLTTVKEGNKTTKAKNTKLMAAMRSSKSSTDHSIIYIIERASFPTNINDMKALSHIMMNTKNSVILDEYRLILEPNTKNRYTLYHGSCIVSTEFVISDGLSSAMSDYCNRKSLDIISIF